LSRARVLLGLSTALVTVVPVVSISCAATEDGVATPPPSNPLPEGAADDGGDEASTKDGGCDSAAPDCISAPVSCNDVSWCPSNTGIANLYVLTKVWGTSKNDVWAVGSGGTVIHWDGGAWTPSAVPPSPAEVRNTFFAVGGTGPNDVWVASTTSSIFHNTGSGWVKQESPAPKGYELVVFSIWSDGSDRFRLGTSDFEYVITMPKGERRVRGNQFAGMTTDKAEIAWEPQEGTASVLGYYGTADDLWLIGDNSTYMPWQRALTVHGVRSALTNELVWTEVESNSLAKLNAIWGSSATDIWAVGDQGVLRRMRPGQTSWEIVPSPTNESLYALWGTSATDIWAAGENGTILHYDGVTWSPDRAAFPVGKKKPHLTGIWGSAPDDVWIVGGGLALHYTGAKEGSR
jgi:photosystem II stability/assembly factor-like uncharacterized protein